MNILLSIIPKLLSGIVTSFIMAFVWKLLAIVSLLIIGGYGLYKYSHAKQLIAK